MDIAEIETVCHGLRARSISDLLHAHGSHTGVEPVSEDQDSTVLPIRRMRLYKREQQGSNLHPPG